MFLLPIPYEVLNKKKKTNKSKKTQKHSLVQMIREKLNLKKAGQDEKLIGNTCYKMTRYLKDPDSMSEKELQNLLHGLEKSVLVVQKTRRKKLEKKRK